MAEREEVFIAAEKADNTPIVKGSKKRRKVKLLPPQPTTVALSLVISSQSMIFSIKRRKVTTQKILTAEEIATLYEDSDPGE